MPRVDIVIPSLPSEERQKYEAWHAVCGGCGSKGSSINHPCRQNQTIKQIEQLNEDKLNCPVRNKRVLIFRSSSNNTIYSSPNSPR